MNRQLTVLQTEVGIEASLSGWGWVTRKQLEKLLFNRKVEAKGYTVTEAISNLLEQEILQQSTLEEAGATGSLWDCISL